MTNQNKFQDSMDEAYKETLSYKLGELHKALKEFWEVYLRETGLGAALEKFCDMLERLVKRGYK